MNIKSVASTYYIFIIRMATQQRTSSTWLYSALSMSLFGGTPTALQRDIMLDIIQTIPQSSLDSMAHSILNATSIQEREDIIRPVANLIQFEIHEIYDRHRHIPPQQQEDQIFTPMRPRYPPETTRRITKPIYKVKSVALNKAQAETHKECAICQDNHNYSDTTQINSCKHLFGTQCVQNWMEICWTRDNKRATCPSCRIEIFATTEYRARAKRATKQLQPV